MSTEQAHVPGIYKKLHAIMSEANYIQKDKVNPHFNYAYASEAAIKTTLHALFVKHLVLPCFSTANQQVAEISRNANGKGRYRTVLDLTYRFIDIEDGSSVEGMISGAGVDDEDKGTYKAITGALKYCLTSQFIIPTGDDPEGDSDKSEKKQAPAHKERTSTTIGAPSQPPPSTDTSQAPPSSDGLAGLLNSIVVLLLEGKDAEFATQMKDRFAQYGPRTKVSDKQLAWLKRLAKQCAVPVGTSEHERYVDDDIPF